MKRRIVIAGAAVLLTGMGAGAYFYLMPMNVPGTAAQDARPNLTSTAVGGLGIATEKGGELALLVNQLGAAQDRVVRGDIGALADQERLLTEISGVLRNFKKQDWDNYTHVRNAFVYVLSGGDSSILKPLADDETRYAADRTLAQGILKYAQEETGAARKLLANIDPRSLDISLVGPFALARASLYIGNDDVKAIALLDEARLACPHSAIEEAAARREIPLLMSNGNASRSILLMTDYLRRFGKSIYAWKLFRDFSEAVAKHDEFDGSDIVEKLTVATSAADKQSRIKLFIAMAAAALPPGRIALARAAASEALSLKPEGADDISRATLYEAAANAPTTRAAEALASLHRIPADRFSGGDTEMHEMAGYIARTIALDKIAENTVPGKGDEQRNAVAPLPPQDLSRVTSAIEKANAAIKAADKIMSGDMK